MKIGKYSVRQSLTGSQILKAMEAGDDLTTETRTMMRNTVRAGNQTADTPGAEPDPNTTPGMNTEPVDTVEDDGMGGDLGNPGPDAGDDELGGGMDDMGGDDPIGGGGMDDMGGGMDDMGGMDGMGDDQPTPEQARLIATLQTNINALYSSVTGLMNGLNGYAAPSASQEVRELYSKALVQLSSVEQLIIELQRKKITPKTYPGKLYRYATIRHAYGLIVDSIATHFDAVDVENGRPRDGEE